MSVVDIMAGASGTSASDSDPSQARQGQGAGPSGAQTQTQQATTQGAAGAGALQLGHDQQANFHQQQQQRQQHGQQQQLHHRRQPTPDVNFADAPILPSHQPPPQHQHLQQQQQHQIQQHLQAQQQQQGHAQTPTPTAQQQHPRPPQQFHQQPALPNAASPQQQQSQYQQYSPQQQQQQQQPQPQPQYAAMNGVNGANMAAMPAPAPTPAGHQAELNYIYGMVEELSRQLADNRRVTEDIVSGLGRVRTRARSQGLANDDLMGAAADDLEVDSQNLDALVSILSEALEKANHSRDQNAGLLSQYASALALMLRQFHEYKAKHVADVAAWHRSYRAQLDEARRENSRLREQMWEMQAHARAANDSLRGFRRRWDEDEARWAARVDAVAARQEVRFWKRMAMPELEDDDPYWSGDDDVIDVAEKDRQQELERRAAQEQVDGRVDDDDEAMMGAVAPDAQAPLPHLTMLGGIAMQRDDPPPRAVPMPPPRPLSAASSTGSTGQ